MFLILFWFLVTTNNIVPLNQFSLFRFIFVDNIIKVLVLLFSIEAGTYFFINLIHCFLSLAICFASCTDFLLVFIVFLTEFRIFFWLYSLFVWILVPIFFSWFTFFPSIPVVFLQCLLVLLTSTLRSLFILVILCTLSDPFFRV